MSEPISLDLRGERVHNAVALLLGLSEGSPDLALAIAIGAIASIVVDKRIDPRTVISAYAGAIAVLMRAEEPVVCPGCPECRPESVS